MMLSDILPTGYHGTELAQVGIGDSVVDLGRRPGRADGGDVGPAARRRPGLRRRPPARPAQAGRALGRDPDRRQQRRRRPADPGRRPAAKAPTGASRPSATRPTTTTGQEKPGMTINSLDPGGPPDRAHRGGRRVRPRGSGRRRRAGQAGQVRLRLRHLLLQGPVDGHRSGQRQAVQPAAAQPDPPRQAEPGTHRVPRAEPRPGRRGLRATSTTATTAGPRCCSTPDRSR